MIQITSPKKDPEAQPAADREAREKAQAVTTRLGGVLFPCLFPGEQCSPMDCAILPTTADGAGQMTDQEMTLDQLDRVSGGSESRQAAYAQGARDHREAVRDAIVKMLDQISEINRNTHI